MCLQFGTQAKFRQSRNHNNQTAENAFSTPWYFSEMEFEPVVCLAILHDVGVRGVVWKVPGVICGVQGVKCLVKFQNFKLVS